ncbi:MAG: ankyrin repeat domain-containing protein, partial [Legionellales bacterium]
MSKENVIDAIIHSDLAKLKANLDLCSTEVLNAPIDNIKRQTVLHLAVRTCNINIVNAVLAQEGIDVNIQDGEGNTPLHLAASRDATLKITPVPEMRRMHHLVESYGTIYEHFDDDFNEIARQLMNHHADIGLENVGHQNPVQIAQMGHDEEMLL